jgi:tetratricopeptide (TPR) repeat protein
MKPNPLTQIRKILAKIYPTENDIRRVLNDIDIDPGRIAFDGKAINIWDNVLQEAKHHGKLSILVNFVGEKYPRYKERLTKLLNEYNEQETISQKLGQNRGGIGELIFSPFLSLETQPPVLKLIVGISAISGIIFLVLVISSGIIGPKLAPVPPIPEGEIGVLVTSFHKFTDEECEIANNGISIRNAIYDELYAHLDYIRENPEDILRKADDLVCDTSDALRIASKYGVNIVVFGEVMGDGGEQFRVKFVTTDPIVDAEEIAIELNKLTFATVSEEELAKTRLFASVVSGLIEYLNDEDERAIETFEDCLKDSNFSNILEENIKIWAAINIYRGRSYLELSKYIEAINAFETILERTPDYTWANIGMGMTYYAQSEHLSQQDACKMLERALEEFNKALYGKGGMYVIAKAHYGIGIVNYVKYQQCSCEECCDIAKNELETALEEHTEGDAPEVHLAKVHYALGGVNYHLGETVAALNNYEACFRNSKLLPDLRKRCEIRSSEIKDILDSQAGDLSAQKRRRNVNGKKKQWS